MSWLDFGRRKTPIAQRHAPQIEAKSKVPALRRVSRQRNFQAADTVSDAFASWTTTNLNPDELVYKSLRILRARSRQLMVSTDFAPAFVRLCENHIIGNTGYRFQARARDTNGELDAEANKALEYAWQKWGRNQTCDFKGKHNQVSFDKLIIRTTVVDGEAFIQEMNHPSGETCFRLHDPETIPVDINVEKTRGQNLIRFGIEYDSKDRPVAYYVRDRNGSVTFTGGYSRAQIKVTRIPADKMIHVYVQDRVDLRRGFPWMAPSMVRVRMISKLEDSAVQNAITGASNFGVLSGAGSDDVVTSMEENGDKVIETEGINIFETPHEVDFMTFDSKFPDADFPGFIKTNLRSLASGLGVNYNTLSGDLEGVNFSSLKHGTSEERETWKALQMWFVQDWKNHQKDRWLKRQLLIGIPLKPYVPEGSQKFLPLDKYQKFREVDFNGRRWVGPDPLKEASANAIDMKNNTRSPQEIIIDRGGDPDKVIEETADWYAKMRENEIPVEVGANVINVNMGEENATQKKD